MGDREGLKSLLSYINEQRGIDFSLYRHATVMRKLDLRLQATGARSYSRYLEYLKSRPAEMENLIHTLTIKVTSFFRNPLVFELLSSRVIPEVMSAHKSVRIWSLGCASGEEPYSLAIIVSDILRAERNQVNVEIVGTDIDSGATAKAIRGEYPESEIAEVRKKHVDEFFEVVGASAPRDRAYRISDQIKSMVRFETDDIVSGLRRARDAGYVYHIILCRNVLIYMNRSLQENVLASITGLLVSGGYLVIGESESLPDQVVDKFKRPFEDVKIYRRKPPAL